MRQFVIVFSILFFGVCSVNADINWIMNYDTALTQAQIEDKDLFVLITAPSWCGPCMYMESETFTDPDLIEMINANFIPLKVLDEVDGRWNPDLNNFDFSGYPTYLILSSQEKVVFQDSGAVDPSSLLSYLEPYLPFLDESPVEEYESDDYTGTSNLSGLVAYFPFTDGMDDLSGTGSLIDDYPYPPERGVLYNEGIYSTTYGEYFTLHPSELDYGNFSLGMSIQLNEIDGLLSFITGGSYYRWFSLIYRNNELWVSFNNDADKYPSGFRGLKTRQWYDITFSINLEQKSFTLILDEEEYSQKLPNDFNIDANYPGAHPDRAFFLINYSYGRSFNGYIDNVFVLDHSLTPEESENLKNQGIQRVLNGQVDDSSIGNSNDQLSQEQSFVNTEADFFKEMPDGSELLDSQNTSLERKIFNLVNQERRNNDLHELYWSEELAFGARYQAADMAVDTYFEHDSFDRRSDGGLISIGTWEERLKAFASHICIDTSCLPVYGYLENIAAGSNTAEEFFQSWMKSPMHKANILSREVKYIGIGYWEAEEGDFPSYCVQDFAY